MNRSAYEALRSGAAVIDSSGRGKIRLMGEDRVRLMHAMTTNHIEQLTPGAGCYAFFLNAQGRILGDVNVFALPEYLLLDTEPQTGPRIYEHLDKFIIADDVTLEDLNDTWASISVEGPDSEDILTGMGATLPASPGGIAEWGARLVAAVTITGSPGHSLYLPAEGKAELLADLEAAGAAHADTDAIEVVRLEHARARYGIDFGETNIPQETQQMHALHFSKGCYLGQEIVERVRSRGHVSKMLKAVEVETTEELDPGAKVMSGEKEVGEITSSAFSPALEKVVGFAMLRREAVEGQTNLTAGGAPLAIRST
ncbi:MAG TPA: glycine cleavage T C-terminal barrel domain-containing protein [Bryobacteraceae bacterium]|nr:glycine cleavage T C-terminal barrel domain-containing protein [Bryobacteraceae bacterium]